MSEQNFSNQDYNLDSLYVFNQSVLKGLIQ